MSLAMFATISRLGRVVRTGEAAAALNTSLSQASRSLHTLEAQGLAQRVHRGVWIIGTETIDPRALAEEMTTPHPAYVSFLSALNAHGVIDQIPRDISVASLASAKRVETPVGTFAIHHLPPALFGGWEEQRGLKIAHAEKALFDLAYVAAVHRGRQRSIPELDLPRGFARAELRHWLGRISSERVRTMTARGIELALTRAVR